MQAFWPFPSELTQNTSMLRSNVLYSEDYTYGMVGGLGLSRQIPSCPGTP